MKEENRRLLQEKAENEQMMRLLETQKEVLTKNVSIVHWYQGVSVFYPSVRRSPSHPLFPRRLKPSLSVRAQVANLTNSGQESSAAVWAGDVSRCL